MKISEFVLTTKNSNALHKVQDTLHHNFKTDRRNYTITYHWSTVDIGK